MNTPIELWRKVVHPTVRQPLARVGIQLVESVEAVNPGRVAGPPNPKWTHAELYPRLLRLDRPISRVNERIDVLATPARPHQRPARAVSLPTRVVRKIQNFSRSVGFRVGIKVVVEVNA